MSTFSLFCLFLAVTTSLTASERPAVVGGFLEQRCFECHDAETKKGDLDLTALGFDLEEAKTFARWVKVHDRVRDGEMPPKKKARPEPTEVDAFLKSLSSSLVAIEQ